MKMLYSSIRRPKHALQMVIRCVDVIDYVAALISREKTDYLFVNEGEEIFLACLKSAQEV